MYRCSTLELKRMSILSSIVYHICRYALYVVMTLRLSDHRSHLNSAERRDRDVDKIKSSQETRSWTEICVYCACIAVVNQQWGLFLWFTILDFRISSAPSALDRNLKGRRNASGTVLTRFACKNDPYIHLSMTSTFCLVTFCLYVCIHGLFSSDLWDLNEYMLCSS